MCADVCGLGIDVCASACVSVCAGSLCSRCGSQENDMVYGPPCFGALHPLRGVVPNVIPGVMYLGLAYAVGTTIPKYL